MISMDFIITFTIYMLALSFFFFSIKNSFGGSNPGLDVSTELVFNKIDNVYNEDYVFLDNSKMTEEKYSDFISGYNEDTAYKVYFKEFEKPYIYRKIDYCIFIENKTDTGIEVIGSFSASNFSTYNITFFNQDTGNNDRCGSPGRYYYDYKSRPECNIVKADVVVVSKPILYDRDIMNLRIMMCAERR